MATPSYANVPQILYLYQVLDHMESGELLVPDFQRPIRWDDEQRLRLLQSVAAGYPIGSILVWRTDSALHYRERIGPCALPEGPGQGQRQYLLDGFQRMGTLLAALRAPPGADPAADIDGHRWLLGYNLRSQAWQFLNDTPPEQEPVVLPARILLNVRELLRFQRGLKGDDAEQLVERSDALASTFKEYKIPIVPLVTSDLNKVTEIFGLLNTEGTRMGELDLLTAVTWSPEYDLRERLNAAKDTLGRVGWEKLDERFLLASLRLAAGKDVYDAASLELGRDLRADPRLLDEAVGGLVLAAEFLQEHCNIVSLDLLPYSYQAVLLGDALRQHPVRSAQIDASLVRWFWWTTAGGTFAGISGRRMTLLHRYLVELAAGSQPTWRLKAVSPVRLPGGADPRTALTRMVTLEYQERRNRDAAVQDRLRRQGARALFRGLTLLPPEQARDLGNLFLATAEDEPGLVEALREWQGGQAPLHRLHSDPAYRAAHHITDSAWERLGRGDGGGFVQERREALEAFHREFLASVGPPPGEGA